MTTLVYQYGLATPYEEHDRILDQMRCAHRYRNTLIEIERGRRAALRALQMGANADLVVIAAHAESAEIGVANCVQTIRQERARTQKRSDTPEQRAALKTAKLHKSACVAALRAARKSLLESPKMIHARDLLSERARELRRSAREFSGLARRGPHYGAWGTYQLVEEAAQASFASIPLYGQDGLIPNDPKFLQWTGDGAVSVQIQKGGASLDQATNGEHPQLRITLPDERAWINEPGNSRSDRKRYARQGELAICLGTDDGGHRIYGRWRLDMHRPIHKEGIIKRATVHRRVCGPYVRWLLDLTIECPLAARIDPTLGGSVAVDLGWRIMGDELRVAGWADAYGQNGDLRLGAKLLAALHDPERIRRERDQHLNGALVRLRKSLSELNGPAWIFESTRYMANWRPAVRLVILRNRWHANRFDGDDCAYEALNSWAKADRAYWAQETRRREASLAHRREIYRIFAAKLTEKYEVIILEQFDLRVFAKYAPLETDTTENKTARSNRHLAAVSELRLAIINAASSRGRTVVTYPAHDTTRTCPVCGLVTDRSAADRVILNCDCGAIWDQDVTGAPKILLMRHCERTSDAKIVVAARNNENVSKSLEKKESRRERVRRLRAAKEERMGSARQAD